MTVLRILRDFYVHLSRGKEVHVDGEIGLVSLVCSLLGDGIITRSFAFSQTIYCLLNPISDAVGSESSSTMTGIK